jgi:hypothetical protein
MSTQRVFNAIDGEELRKIILRDLDKELSLDGDFRQHVTYPVVEWTWKLTMKVIARDQEVDREISGSIRQFDPESKLALPIPDEEKPRIISVQGSRSIGEKVAPDKVREQQKMPVTVPTKVAGLGTFDKAEEREPRGRGGMIKNDAAKGFTG